MPVKVGYLGRKSEWGVWGGGGLGEGGGEEGTKGRKVN